MQNNETRSYFYRLINGQIPLFITYWIWFIFLSMLIAFFTDIGFSDYEQAQRTKADTYFAIFIYLSTLIYTMFIFMIVIRSANNYKGSKFWSFLAKVTVSINLFISLFSAIDIAKVFFLEDYAIQNQISSYKQNLPIDIDSFTQLYDINKIDKNIIYVYKLKNLNLKDTVNFNKKAFTKKIQNSICDDEGTVDLLKKDYTLKYTYLDKNNETITRVETKKEACGEGIYDLDILKEILKKESHFSLR